MKTMTIRNGMITAILLLVTGMRALAGGTDSLVDRNDSLIGRNDSLVDRLEKVVSAKIAARRIENEQRIRHGLKPDYIIRIGDRDLSGGSDFPTNVYPLLQQNTQPNDAEKLWDFTNNADLQSIPQQLQQWSAAQGYDYYIIVCAIYNYFRLDEETKFNNITWDSIGILSSKSKAGGRTGSSANDNGYNSLFHYLVSKFKTDPSIPKSSAGHPAIYHFVVSAYVPYQGATDNAPSGKLRHFQGLYWSSPNGDTTYDNVFQKFYTSLQAEVAGVKTAKPPSKEAWLAAFISGNQKMIAGIRNLNINDLMACTNADSMYTMIGSTPAQVFSGFTSDQRIHCLQVLAGPEIPDSREVLICQLIEQTPDAQNDALIAALHKVDPYIPATTVDYGGNDPMAAGTSTTIANPKANFCLLQCITEELNDKTLGIWGGDNYHRLIKALTNACFHSNTFLQAVKDLNTQCTDSSLDQLPNRYIGYTYNSIWNKVASTFMNASYVTVPSIDWSVSYLANCQLSIKKELFLSLLYPNATLSTTPLDPFAPIIFQNKSDLGLLTDLADPATTYILPAIVMKYAAEKGDDQTLSDGVMAAIDVASLASGYGELQAGITGMRKAWVLFDMFNAGINLSVNILNYQNNPTLKQLLTYYNLVTGGITAGRISSGAITGIYNGIRTQANNVLSAVQLRQFLAQVKAAGPELASLQAEDYVSVKMLVQRTGTEANLRGLSTIEQESQDALAAITSAAQSLAGDLSWIDALIGLTDEVKAALKADILSNPPLAKVFANAALAGKQQLAEAYSLLRGSITDVTAANALFRNPDALTSLSKIRANPALAASGITDDMLSKMRGWGFNGGVTMSYSQVIDNINNFISFLDKEAVSCPNCVYLYGRYLTNADKDKQAVYWIMENIASDEATFANQTLSIEYTLPTTQRIDVALLGEQPPLWIEYKWYGGSSTVSQDVFLSGFVERDLYNAGSLEQLQWRVKGQQLTIDQVRQYLTSTEGQAALKNQNVFILFNNYAVKAGGSGITTMTDLNNYINTQDNWFKLIFK